MSLNATPRGERTHIAVFGRTNVGKSSVVNALTGQEIAVVSPVRGTTTDPVYKAMELLPLGPVVLIDTAGLDDEGTLGELRKQKTRELIHRTDLALLVIDAMTGPDDFYRELLAELRQRNIPVVGVLNKVDALLDADAGAALVDTKAQLGLPECVAFSALDGRGIPELKRAIVAALPHEEERFRLVGGLVAPGDLVVLVVPIDKAAPKGRLILPQQQTIRDLLESDAIAVVTKEHELRATLERLGTRPRLVVTDSQVFLKVAADTPRDVPLTSFSILFARHKGDLNELVRGARAIDRLKDGDRVLIAEACTHHQQSDDIGTVKIPRWLRQATGKQLHIEHVSGYSYPPDLARYAMIVHCGACMLNRRAMLHRLGEAQAAGVPIVNYGLLIAYLHGVFPRAIELFPSAMMAWEEAAQEHQ
ncbi:[FeFe] hydrogenase H-cluster maturation GTPase HydF [Paenibacillus sp. DXFW5]|uniref:[FeFe] hydrogenase H-cluster maturation GTPase HydF n=1 Tax=Paenibacillus rhizolycopersici TaxID=2780073 RepID=A0ABS2HEL7_9BACL|nr:[FeFe] hydrogenase H-cluster maturation GTPase HydF [Paenibacillus rhizolycopersici]MBM6998289.1 [FeFe] hydrogenase H-cluster maturation GTPase HydF [Paenibacillus rhizolycopersici]